MFSSSELYTITTMATLSPWPIFWLRKTLTTLRMIIFLFALDSILTIEAALYSDIVLIAILHVITVPALIGLIYFDLVKEHRSYFRCFVCGKEVQADEEIETINRTVGGKPKHVIVHIECISLERTQRKRISMSIFKRGIPK